MQKSKPHLDWSANGGFRLRSGTRYQDLARRCSTLPAVEMVPSHGVGLQVKKTVSAPPLQLRCRRLRCCRLTCWNRPVLGVAVAAMRPVFRLRDVI